MRFRKLSLAARILVPIITVFSISFLSLALYITRAAKKTAVEASVSRSIETISHFKTLRKYYTENVASKAVTSGSLKVSFDHRGQPGTIPLPATMIHDLSEAFESGGAGGLKLRLYSAHPFPNRAGRRLDAFEEESLRFFKTHPDETFSRVETKSGSETVRVAIADKLVAQSCVDCHNSRADSPKKDWRLGQVRGVLEVVAPIDAQMAATARMTATFGGVSAIGLVVASFIVGWFLRRQIVGPMRQTIEELSAVAGETEAASSEVACASEKLAQGASEQAAALNETSASSERISQLTERNANDSLAAAERMAAVTSRIDQANQSMKEMITSMREIGSSSQRIAGIIKAINEIAFQTNILALNAAVEAARAGEAGMGFAVVADEVRSLAQRSAEAADQTASLIQESIERAKDGNEKIDQMATVIHSITAVADDARKLIDHVRAGSQEQSDGIRQIAAALSQMEGVTNQTAASSEESASAARELSAQAEALETVVAHLSSTIEGTGE